MFKSKFVVGLCAVFAFASICLAGKFVTYSPLGATPGAASVPIKLKVAPDFNYAQTLLITATNTITAGENGQFVMIPLNGLASSTKIKGVRLCYYVDAVTPGATYARVRLNQMDTDDFSAVSIQDDPSILSNTTLSVHTTSISSPFWKVGGTVTLKLNCIFANTSDEIHIGTIQVLE